MYNTVFFNGKPINCLLDISLYDLLRYYEFNLDAIVVEYNKKIIGVDNFHITILKSEDVIEVITIVGGG